MTTISATPTLPPTPLRRALRAAERIDGAVAASCVLLCGIALLAPEQLADSLRFVADSAAGIAPFLIASVLAAAWLSAAGADRLIGHAFRARHAGRCCARPCSARCRRSAPAG